jgi:hypothetical protein
MTDAEQVEENAAAAYHGYQPASTIEERVSRPASEPFARASSNSSPGSVRTRPMTPTEQAHENAAARYHNEQPRTTIDEFVPSRPSSPPRSGRANRDALLTNIRETVPRMNLNRVDHAEPREFVQLALNLTKGTAYEKGMHKLAQTDPALGAGMKERWGALREHLDGLRAQGKENVPRLEWLFENRPSRMMDFLVGGRGGSKLVRPTTQG